MGYSTEFEGQFNVIDTETSKCCILPGWLEDQIQVNSSTRQCEPNDYNKTLPGSPSLWCDWTADQDDCGSIIVWTGKEKTYKSKEWIQRIIDVFLIPNGFTLLGEVSYQGENKNDNGKIQVIDNKVWQRPSGPYMD